MEWPGRRPCVSCAAPLPTPPIALGAAASSRSPGGATAMGCTQARAQALPVIGYLGSKSPERYASRLEAFREGLAGRGLRRRAHGRHRVPVGRRPVQPAAGAGQGARRPPADRHRGARRRRGRAGGKSGDGENPHRVRDGRRSCGARHRGEPVATRRQSHRRVEPQRRGLAQAAGVHARGAADRRPVRRRPQSKEPDLRDATEEPAGRGAEPRRGADRAEGQRRSGVRRPVHRRRGAKAPADWSSAPIPTSPTAANSLPRSRCATRWRRSPNRGTSRSPAG